MTCMVYCSVFDSPSRIRIALPRKRIRLLAAVLATACLISVAARAQDATWLFSPGSGNFNTAGNWTPAAVPTGTAIFDASNTTAVTFGSGPSVGAFQFNAGASAYSFTLGGNILQFTGAGIVNNSSNAPSFSVGNQLNFRNTSTAGNATITNTTGATTQFFNTSTAGNATININNAASTSFQDTSTAGTATIINAGTLDFQNNSTASNATITTNSGGVLRFFQTGTGGQGRFITNAGGSFNMSGLTSSGLTAGSIEGAGRYILGSKQITVGSNNLSTEVSGVISGTGGSLVKSGTGTLTLSGTNSYTGGTTVNAGRLAVNGSVASGVTVGAGGNLGGSGTITGNVVNNGTLSPGNSIGTLTVQGSLIFTAAASYMIEVSSVNADRVNVTGAAALSGTVRVVSMWW